MEGLVGVDFTELVNKAISHKATVDSAKRDIRDNLILIQQETDKLNNLSKEYDTSKCAYAYLDKLVKEESGKFIKSLNDTLNYAMEVIFYDCDYSVDIRTEDNDKISIRLKYTNDDGIPVDADIQKCGGGVRTIVGTILQVTMILKYKAEPILFLDESLSQVSSQYLPYLIALLDELAEKNDFKILLITHDTRLENLASIKHKYQVQDGSIKEVLVSGNDTVDTE